MCQTGLVGEVRAARFMPKGFRHEQAMLESIMRNCKGARTAMLTGNYAVREGPNIEPNDQRLLGREMLLTIELCARAYRRCVERGVEPPAIVLIPNDIIPETFESNTQEREFKIGYAIPPEIREILSFAGIHQEPLMFFNRDFDSTAEIVTANMADVRRRIASGTEKLIVMFESFAQNLAAKALSREKILRGGEIELESSGRRRAIIPASIADTHSGKMKKSATAITITNPNGSPYCSFLAATLFREFESLGFQQMVNTFVSQEHPCVDKAAAAYRHFHGGNMPIRNIYLDGAMVVIDSTMV